MKYWFMLSLALLGPAITYGQLRLEAGPRLGLNMTTAAHNALGRKFDTKFGLRGEVGGQVNIGWRHWSLQASGLFAQKSFRVDDEWFGGTVSNLYYLRTRQNFRLDYLTAPINLAYQLRRDGQGLQVFAGGYVGRLLGGRVSYDDVAEMEWQGERVRLEYNENRSVRTSNVLDPSRPPEAPRRVPLRPGDVGLQAGVGYRYQRLLVQLGYSRSLRDLGPDYLPVNPNFTMTGPSYKLRGAQLSATYLLGGKK